MVQSHPEDGSNMLVTTSTVSFVE